MESYQPEYDKNGLLSDTFWRTPQRAIPGRPFQTVKRTEVMSGSSYQQFQASVNDAWDLGDDDIISGIAETKISKAISQTAALNVINSHRNSSRNVNKNDVKVESEIVKPKAEAVEVKKNEVRRVGAGSSGPMRHYPGRPRPVRLSALTSREESSESKLERFQQMHDSMVIDLDDLKQISWSGIPVKARAITWRLLAGYLPPNAERRVETLERKRADYKHLVRQYYDAERDDDTYRQIHIDIPRMSPLVALFQQITVQVCTRSELPPNAERRVETLERKRADYKHLVRQYYDAERDDDTYRQIHIDIPRMSPLVALFQQITVQVCTRSELPPNAERRVETLERKRADYKHLVRQYYDAERDDDTYRQIHIDIPRMSPLVALFQQITVQVCTRSELPPNAERRVETLERKRADYKHLVRQYYDAERDDDTYRQIHIDIPRMSPLVALFQQITVQVCTRSELPPNAERRVETLERKRADYKHLVRQYYDAERVDDTYRQIHIDIPRMSPLVALFQQITVQVCTRSELPPNAERRVETLERKRADYKHLVRQYYDAERDDDTYRQIHIDIPRMSPLVALFQQITVQVCTRSELPPNAERRVETLERKRADYKHLVRQYYDAERDDDTYRQIHIDIPRMSPLVALFQQITVQVCTRSELPPNAERRVETLERKRADYKHLVRQYYDAERDDDTYRQIHIDIPRMSPLVALFQQITVQVCTRSELPPNAERRVETLERKRADYKHLVRQYYDAERDDDTYRQIHIDIPRMSPLVALFQQITVQVCTRSELPPNAERRVETLERKRADYKHLVRQYYDAERDDDTYRQIHIDIPRMSPLVALFQQITVQVCTRSELPPNAERRVETLERKRADYKHLVRQYYDAERDDDTYRQIHIDIPRMSPLVALFQQITVQVCTRSELPPNAERRVETLERKRADYKHLVRQYYDAERDDDTYRQIHIDIPRMSPLVALFQQITVQVCTRSELPPNAERRVETLERKRADYKHLVRQYYDAERDDDTYRQIHIDIPRMSPLVALFQQITVQVCTRSELPPNAERRVETLERKRADYKHLVRQYYDAERDDDTYRQIHIDIPRMSPLVALFQQITVQVCTRSELPPNAERRVETLERKRADYKHLVRQYYDAERDDDTYRQIHIDIPRMSPLVALFQQITVQVCTRSELPPNAERRVETLERKRADYKHLVRQYYDAERDDDTYRQIHIDIPRMSPLVALFQQITVQVCTRSELPPNAERRVETLERKRADYKHLVRQYYDAERDDDTYRQIHIDIPRMSPLVALFQQITVQVCTRSELPPNAERRVETLERKRADYKHLVRQYYDAERDDDTYRQIHIDIPRMSPLVALFQQITVQVCTRSELPPNAERRVETLERKRADYKHLVRQYYDAERDDDTYRQIHIDIPRMSPLVALFQQITVQVMFERILYIWAIRHPASGYVQGINDLVTPFFMVFLQEAAPGQELDNFPLDKLTEEQRDIIEADSFWCLSKFLDSIQDNYIFAQLGIQYKVNQLKELIRRIDLPLHEHLQTHGVDYLQFSFRWMNNLLTREIPLPCTIRLWDTYLAESDGFATFQLYVCAAFLLHWRERLMLERDFQGLMILLQNVPTQNWTDSNISVLVAEAYRLKFAFADAPNHLHNAGKSDR
ncbi:hypothetical protein PYW07_008501 [Mythimna separata]|uniref:Rab-GAP TBC domain-containing protein n=36 Tax=Obtectomera TaxID=104431 RepID=A0AAD8DP32_MYTSE|nr:hypothetical protein PYW07_008501 [Mythimna separata]